MSSTLGRALPTESDVDDGVAVGETGGTESSSTNSTTGMQGMPMFPNPRPSSPEARRILSTESVPTPNQSVASDNSHPVQSSRSAILAETDNGGTSQFNLFAWLLLKLSTFYYTLGEIAAGRKYHGLEEASHRRDTYNVVIFGQTGAGKSSLVNLITKTQAVPTFSNAGG
ncbi:uncharacterized protein F5891DRAFT_1009981, partial [Suillus fuscotomentosus]